MMITAVMPVMPARAGEVELKAIEPLEKEKQKWGPYVGVFGGASQSQSAKANAQGNNLIISESDGDALFGLEIGHSWPWKKAPLEFALEFEAFYFSSELSGMIDPADLPSAADSDLGSFTTDMNAAVFMVNGMLVGDFRRFRPRIGRVPTGFRPYVGAGVGGAQLWFRNTETRTVDQLGDPDSTTVLSEAAFDQDQFVLAYQFFAGLEYNFNDKLAAYVEWRRFTFEKFDLVRDLETEGIVGGLHLRY